MISEAQRTVLAAFGNGWSRAPTYVIRNVIRSPYFETPRILRICKRLTEMGLLQRARTDYRVMHVYEITPAGRAALKEHANE